MVWDSDSLKRSYHSLECREMFRGIGHDFASTACFNVFEDIRIQGIISFAGRSGQAPQMLRPDGTLIEGFKAGAYAVVRVGHMAVSLRSVDQEIRLAQTDDRRVAAQQHFQEGSATMR